MIGPSGFMFGPKPKPVRCALCGNRKGDHKAVTFNCPMGKRSRIGHITFNKNQFYEPPTAANGFERKE